MPRHTGSRSLRRVAMRTHALSWLAGRQVEMAGWQHSASSNADWRTSSSERWSRTNPHLWTLLLDRGAGDTAVPTRHGVRARPKGSRSPRSVPRASRSARSGGGWVVGKQPAVDRHRLDILQLRAGPIRMRRRIMSRGVAGRHVAFFEPSTSPYGAGYAGNAPPLSRGSRARTPDTAGTGPKGGNGSPPPACARQWWGDPCRDAGGEISTRGLSAPRSEPPPSSDDATRAAPHRR